MTARLSKTRGSEEGEMKALITLAIRNLFRHTRRLVLTALTIAVGIAFFTFIDSLMSAMDNISITNIKALTAASARIETKAYADDADGFPLTHFIDGYDALRAKLLSLEPVLGVTKRTRFLGELSDYRESLPVFGIAIDLETDETVFALNEYITEGKALDDEEPNQILIGKRLADDFNLRVGDSVIVLARDVYDSQNADDFVVTGVFDTDDPMLNAGTVYLSYASANALLSIEGNATEVTANIPWRKGVSYKNYFDAVDETVHALAFDETLYSVQTIRDASKDMLAVSETKNTIMPLFYLIIAIIALVGVLNTALMSVYERIREIGVLRALGFSGSEIVTLFVIEGGLIGVVGALFGCVLGALCNIYLVYYGLNIASFGVEGASLGMPITIYYGQWNPLSFVAISVFSVIAALIASYFPARKGANVTVTAAMRFQ